MKSNLIVRPTEVEDDEKATTNFQWPQAHSGKRSLKAAYNIIVASEDCIPNEFKLTNKVKPYRHHHHRFFLREMLNHQFR